MVMQERGHVEVCRSHNFLGGPSCPNRKFTETNKLRRAASSTKLCLDEGQFLFQRRATPSGTGGAPFRRAARPAPDRYRETGGAFRRTQAAGRQGQREYPLH